MISYKERQYLCWFLSVPGIGAVTGMRLFKQFKSFEEIYNIEGKNLENAGFLRPKEAAAFDAEKCQLDRRKRELEELEKEGIRLIAFLMGIIQSGCLRYTIIRWDSSSEENFRMRSG